MTRLESLRLRAIALRSTIHNEHMMNAQELCAMVSKKTNDLIDVINELCEDVENLQEKVSIIYDETTENLTINN